MTDSGSRGWGNPVATIPSNEQAEEALLGSVFLDREVVGRVMGTVQPEDFWIARCRVAWTAMVTLYERAEPVDPITLLDEYARQKIEPDTYWLYSLIGVVPTPINALSYASIIADLAQKRRLITAGGRIASLGYQDDLTAEDAIEKADLILADANQSQRGSAFVRVDVLLKDYLEQQTQIDSQSGAGLTYRIPTGFETLDRRLGGGVMRSDLMLVAARPGMGKSAFALGLALNAAIRYSAGVAIFSLEMAASQLVARMVAIESEIPYRMIRDNTATRRQQEAWGDALGRIAGAPIWVDETPNLPIGDIRARARQLMRIERIDFIIVDHVQLIQSSRQRDTVVAQTSEVSLRLKGLARELNVPVVALAQLSRKPEERKPPEPILSDLRESGSLEQDADTVLLLYREDYYNKASGRVGAADITIAKQRNGETGKIQMYWDAGTTRFVDLARFRERE